MVLDTAKLKHRKNAIFPTTRGRDAAKELTAKKNITKEFTIVFLRDQVFRESQLKIGWTEQKCIEVDKLAQEDHSYLLFRDEFKRYQGRWYLTLNKSGKNAPVRLRSDFRAAVTIMSRLHRESGEECAEPFSFHQYRRGTLLQVIPCGTGTRPKAGGAHEFNSFFMFVAVGFVYS